MVVTDWEQGRSVVTQKKKTKKYCIIMASLLVIAIFAALIGYKEWQKREEQYNTKLKWAYQNETRAFAMDRSDCYKNYSYVDVNSLIINLASYMFIEPGTINRVLEKSCEKQPFHL